jgi:hypothetical protein
VLQVRAELEELFPLLHQGMAVLRCCVLACCRKRWQARTCHVLLQVELDLLEPLGHLLKVQFKRQRDIVLRQK